VGGAGRLGPCVGEVLAGRSQHSAAGTGMARRLLTTSLSSPIPIPIHEAAFWVWIHVGSVGNVPLRPPPVFRVSFSVLPCHLDAGTCASCCFCCWLCSFCSGVCSWSSGLDLDNLLGMVGTGAAAAATAPAPAPGTGTSTSTGAGAGGGRGGTTCTGAGTSTGTALLSSRVDS
jgi:hypothetical protein